MAHYFIRLPFHQHHLIRSPNTFVLFHIFLCWHYNFSRENPLIQFRTMRAYECQKKTHLDSACLISNRCRVCRVLCVEFQQFSNMDINIMAQLVNCSCSLHGFCLPTDFLSVIYTGTSIRDLFHVSECMVIYCWKAWRIVAFKKKNIQKTGKRGPFCSISICI